MSPTKSKREMQALKEEKIAVPDFTKYPTPSPEAADAPPLLRFHDPKTGDAVYPEMVPDGKGGWKVSNPWLIAGLEPG